MPGRRKASGGQGWRSGDRGNQGGGDLGVGDGQAGAQEGPGRERFVFRYGVAALEADCVVLLPVDRVNHSEIRILYFCKSSVLVWAIAIALKAAA